MDEIDYDMILLDIQMPEMNGFEVAKHIRERVSTPFSFPLWYSLPIYYACIGTRVAEAR